jgi:hypothetical protein
MPTAILIESFKISKRGIRQMQITIPRNWIEDNELKEGYSIDLLKDITDRLIIVPGDRQEQE